MQPNRLLVVQTGESVDQAKVIRAHAVPQGLCGNLVDALQLLANQQEDGDGFVQNIVTNLCEESREGLTNGLREFIMNDKLTLRTEEVGTWKSYVNVNHMEKERWVLLWTGTPSVRRCTKASIEKTGESNTRWRIPRGRTVAPLCRQAVRSAFFLLDWEVAKVNLGLPESPGHVVPGIA